MTDPRLVDGRAAIDAANADDPEVVQLDGDHGPKALLQGVRAEAWVERLDPEATDAQRLAARAHHLRRWMVPRTSEPEGRAGYLRWRAAQKRRHADEVAEILDRVGYDRAFVDEVQRLVRKEGRDPAAQAHEDALCLVFLETELEETAARLGHDKTVDIVGKTARKMSPRSLEAARAVSYGPLGTRVMADVLDGA